MVGSVERIVVYMIDFIYQPAGTIRLGDYLKSHFQQNEWTHFRAAIAFVKHSGTRHIQEALSSFSIRANVKISVGIDTDGTSMEGLLDLLESVGNKGEIWVFHNENSSTFHPKIYLFKNNNNADVIVGSGNLTEGGLFTNYEAAFAISLDLTVEEHKKLLMLIENVLDTWSHLASKTSLLLTKEILNQLVANEDVPSEVQAKEIDEIATHFRESAERAKRLPLFARVAVPKAPQISRESFNEQEEAVEENFEVEVPISVPAQSGHFTGFVMTLQKTDVGRGQTTSGTSQRSPEIFIPLIIRDYDPDFWSWPYGFTPDETKPGKMDRHGVKMRIGTTIVDVNMMTWPDKSDFRLRSEALRSAGNIGDILRMEKMDGQAGFAYYVEVIPQGTTLHAQFLSLCTNPVRNSRKMWNYYSATDLDDKMIGSPQKP